MAGIFLATVFIFVVLFAELPKAITVKLSYRSSVTIGNHICQKVLATKTIIQTDERDGRCTGKVTYHVCGGNCLSWQKPVLDHGYKSYHPVCIHAGLQDVRRPIDWDCTADFNPTYEWMNVTEPTECECSICNSSYTSCQFQYKRTMDSRLRSQPSSRRIYIPKSVAESKRRKEWAYESLPSIYLI